MVLFSTVQGKTLEIRAVSTVHLGKEPVLICKATANADLFAGTSPQKETVHQDARQIPETRGGLNWPIMSRITDFLLCNHTYIVWYHSLPMIRSICQYNVLGNRPSWMARHGFHSSISLPNPPCIRQVCSTSPTNLQTGIVEAFGSLKRTCRTVYLRPDEDTGPRRRKEGRASVCKPPTPALRCQSRSQRRFCCRLSSGQQARCRLAQYCISLGAKCIHAEILA